MDEATYHEAIHRIEQFTIFLAVAGTILAWAVFDYRHALGFAAGTILAYLSFLIMKRLANALGSTHSEGTTKKQPRAGSAVGVALRYVVIGGVLFGLTKYGGVSLWPIFAGLMTTVAAVLAEIVYELWALRKS